MRDGEVGNVSGNNNVKWTKQLFDKLDAKDSNKDGKIDASIWNSFLESIGSKGNKINNFIESDRAEKSFEYYKSTKDGDKVDWSDPDALLQKFDEWLAQQEENPATNPSGGAFHQPPPKPAAGEASATAPAETKTYDNGRTLEVKEENGAKTYTLKEDDKTVQLETDKDGNVVAYPKSGENFKATAKRLGIQEPYDDSNQVYKDFCELNSQALGRKGGGGWFKVGEQVKIPQSLFETLNLDDYAVDNKNEIANYKKAADAKSISPKLDVEDEKANEVISEAAKFVADVANTEPKPEAELGRNDSDKYDYQKVNIGNDKYIKIYKYDDGALSVRINYDPTQQQDGGNYFEVCYTIVGESVVAYVDTDITSNNAWEVNGAEVNDTAFLDNLTKVMEKIFGSGALTPKGASTGE